MISSLIHVVTCVAGAIASIFGLKACANRQRREAEDDVRAAEEKSKAAKDEIRSAVYSNDDSKVNELVTGVLAPVLLVVSLIVGCSSPTPTSTVVYIPTDRRIETCTNSIGIVCKAVPNAVFAELLCAAQELKELKTEMKVDKRVGK